ncbi:hypothetical protein H6G91_36395 [Nostoc muscorum FACHB-395]|nr:hypothetical protein [Desmonostoc muscorum FACHB-395]
MNRNLYEVILKFGSVEERLFNVFAFDEQAVFNDVKRLYPSSTEDNIVICLAVGGYTGVEKDYPEYGSVD